ncbi:MAG TPA: alpha/beta fold hydrolase [Chloroflexaceae bacterium]|nr:alpha/beta fold hydrolase [Chloroflexaceae bacterium]
MHADPLIREALEVWMPRFLNGGIYYDDILWTTARMRSWDDWGPEWMRTAATHEALAEEALAAGNRHTAVQALETASAYYHMAYFIYTRDPELHARGLRKMVELHERALPLLEPAVEKVRIPFEGDAFTGLLSRPRSGRAPVVIFIPGLDSTKESRHRARGGYLRRGMAVLSIDGPGQGETSERLPIRPDYEAAVAAAIDYLEGRDDVDAGRVGLNGGSLGGYYAPRAAAFEPRVRACVGNCGPYDWGECFEIIPQVTREAFQHYSGARDMDEARRLAAGLTMGGAAERITCPLLIMHGRLDPLIPWEQGRRIVEEARGPKQFALFDEGNHALNNIPYKSGPLAADWLARQLGASA